MSAPETTSKGRPSLLSETAPGAADKSSRILASLEGRVAAQQAPRPFRLKKEFAAVALVVVGLGVIGAWQWHSVQDRAYPVTGVVGGSVAQVATAGASGATAGRMAQDAVSSPSPSPSARVAQDRQGLASTPQAAVIVADETPASSPSVAGTDPLSRALASGAVATGPVTAGGAGASGAASASAKSAARKPADARDSAKRRRAEKLAAARAGTQTRGGAAQDDADADADADLLSALVARTKPYDSHPSKKGRSGGKAASAKEHPVSLAARVKECEKSNFFEAQICRWHVCSDHWGKDPACPSPSSSQTTR